MTGILLVTTGPQDDGTVGTLASCFLQARSTGPGPAVGWAGPGGRTTARRDSEFVDLIVHCQIESPEPFSRGRSALGDAGLNGRGRSALGDAGLFIFTLANQNLIGDCSPDAEARINLSPTALFKGKKKYF